MAQLPAPLKERANLLVGDQAYLAKLRNDPDITDEQWNALTEYFTQNAASPMQPSIICKDAECPYIESCPLKRAEIPRPEGQPCVIEETVKRNWAEIYLPEVGESPDGFKAVDTGMVIDLVSTLLDIHRAQAEVSEMPNVAERVLRGVDSKGKPIVELKMNPLHFYLGNARKLKMKILEQLVATRDARRKDKSRTTQDATQLLTEMRATLDAITQQKRLLIEENERLRAQVGVQDAEFTPLDPDAVDPGEEADDGATPPGD